MELAAELRAFSRQRILNAIRRWMPVIAASVAAAMIAAYGVSSVLPSQYRATAQLYLAPAASATAVLQDPTTGQALARSYVLLAQQDVVVRPALESLGLTDLKDFREHLTVQQVRDTSVISISFVDTDPSRAAVAANAVADQFIQRSKDLQQDLQGSAVAQLQSQIETVQAGIKDLDAQITSLRTALATSPRPGASADPSRADLQAQLNQRDADRLAKQSTLAQLLKTRDDLQVSAARASSTVSLWQPAVLPTERESPRPGLNALLGGMVGLVLSLMIVAVVTYLDDRILEPEELRTRLGLAPLAQVHQGANPESVAGKLFMRDQPGSPEAESFRALRTNVLFANVDRRPRSLMVTSARAGEGKSVVSANLALAFAEAGTPTILIDADLRRPSQHRLFRISAMTGLTTLLADPTSLTMHLASFRIAPNLMVIPSGSLPPNPAELLSSARMSTLVEQLSRSDGLVILDTGPVLPIADPLALSTKVDACLLVVDAGRTHTAAVVQAIAALRRVHANLAGAVLNKVVEHQGDYEYQGYQRHDPSAGSAARPRRA
jgi:succinoglycan biosynthesis transport protein ExoP